MYFLTQVSFIYINMLIYAFDFNLFVNSNIQ